MRKAILLIAFLLLAPLSADAAIALVAGQATTPTQSTSTTHVVAFASNITAGNLVVIFAMKNTAVDVASVAGCGGEAYTLAHRQDDAVNGIGSEIWYKEGAAGGCTDVTITVGSSVELTRYGREYSGAATSSALDQVSGQNTAATTTHQCSSLAPSVNNTLVLAAAHLDTSVGGGTANASFVEVVDTSRVYVEEWVQTTATATTAAWTSTNTASGSTACSNFKEAAAGGDTRRPVIGGGFF